MKKMMKKMMINQLVRLCQIIPQTIQITFFNNNQTMANNKEIRNKYRVIYKTKLTYYKEYKRKYKTLIIYKIQLINYLTK